MLLWFHVICHFEPMATLMCLVPHLRLPSPVPLICHYAEKGKIIEFAALYLASLVKSSCYRQEMYFQVDCILKEQMTLRQYVVNQLTSLYCEECILTLMESSQLFNYQEKKQRMMSVLMLLEIFARCGVQMSAHLNSWESLPKHSGISELMADCIESSGFKLTDKDIDLSTYSKYISEKPYVKRSEEYSNMDDPEARQWLSHYDAMADCGWNKCDPEHKKWHPLRVALESLWYRSWRRYCFKKALDTCRILVDKMERVNEVACCYAKEGKVFALTILLLLAREEVIDPMISEVKNDVPLKRSMTLSLKTTN
ncbi:hypothetical protein ACH5RR_038088 [Cinchona calisaya]|uniref:Uncharacterized protein n=1 Tax=Cinchona calisaya TaxID=153742 RepID=A0ABD2Y823_9GENT